MTRYAVSQTYLACLIAVVGIVKAVRLLADAADDTLNRMTGLR